MTKKEMFVAIREAVAENEEFVKFIDHEIELLNSKAASPRKPSKVQQENGILKGHILVTLSEADEPLTIRDIVKATSELEGLTNQRITHLLTDLRKDGKVRRTLIKKVAHFELGNEAEDTAE